jgi:hypothetical protein
MVFSSVKWFRSFMTERICFKWHFSGLLHPESMLRIFFSEFMVSLRGIFFCFERSEVRAGSLFFIIVFCGHVWMPVAVRVGQIKVPEASRY